MLERTDECDLRPSAVALRAAVLASEPFTVTTPVAALVIQNGLLTAR